jgi:hypothetical protein
MSPISAISKTLGEPRHREFVTQLFQTSRPVAMPVRGVILLFRSVLDLSPSGRRSVQIALDAVKNAKDVVLWR